MKNTILIFMILLCANSIFAQTDSNQRNRPQQAIYVEGGAQGILLTFNYDTRFTNATDGIGGRVGVGHFAVEDFSATTIPVGINYLLGKNGKYFELGIGATFGNVSFLGEDVDEFNTTGTMAFGLRLQPEDSGFNFRAVITPIFGDGYFWPYFGGISLGYTFP